MVRNFARMVIIAAMKAVLSALHQVGRVMIHSAAIAMFRVELTHAPAVMYAAMKAVVSAHFQVRVARNKCVWISFIIIYSLLEMFTLIRSSTR